MYKETVREEHGSVEGSTWEFVVVTVFAVKNFPLLVISRSKVLGYQQYSKGEETVYFFVLGKYRACMY